MIEFREVTIDMKPLVDSYFRNSGNMGCEFTFSNLFIWRKKNKTTIAEYKGFLFVRYIIGGKCYFLRPVAKSPETDIKPAFEALIEYTRATCCKLVIAGITSEGKAQIEGVMPDIFDFEARPDWFDYIYNADDLINLRGSKYQAKRNHINKFEQLKGKDTFEEMGSHNIADCLETYNRWAAARDQEELRDEQAAVAEALNNFEALGLKGGLSRSGGNVCAFTVGAELSSDVFVIHIEKGLIECVGVYAAINRDFARHYLRGYRYINREEDMGIEGLRKAKQSYYPAIHLEKNIAVLRDRKQESTAGYTDRLSEQIAT
ncbi:MAG: DUF2156 domain-containing protein [Bacteroidales bacterium]|nr:DUF2156 domain-containing protein [Bacteroidales bacterium]